MFASHVHGLERVFLFQSPPGFYYRPRIVEPGIEEVEVIVAGKGRFTLRGQAVDVGVGGSLWYYAGEEVEVTSDSLKPHHAIVFRFLVSQQPEDRCQTYSLWKNISNEITFCRQMHEVYVSRSYPQKHFAYYLYSCLFWECQQTALLEKQRLPLGFETAIRLIEKHYLEEITTHWLAERADISLPYLNQLFQRQLGISPKQFILQKRLARAKHLLITTDMQIKRIAQESGFSELNSFCRLFRLKNNRTPTDFRNEHEHSAHN
jgi:AraC-like DNA-binding protein